MRDRSVGSADVANHHCQKPFWKPEGMPNPRTSESDRRSRAVIYFKSTLTLLYHTNQVFDRSRI